MQIITALQIDDLIFDNTNFILTEVTGLESPSVRLPRYNLPGASGAYISNALYGERPIRIKGVVNAPDGTRATYLANRTTLINNLAYKRDENNFIVPQLMTITLENGQILTTSVYVDTPLQMGFSSDKVDYEDFQISFVAADPFLYSSSAITGSASPPIGGGAAIPTAIPISLAPSAGGSVVIDNIGSQTAYPIITLNAPLVNPYVTNRTTGKFIKLSKTINVGGLPVIINCAAQTIYQGADDITGIQSQDSTFWSLVTGNNTIGFSATSGTGTADVSFYPTFTGV